MPGTDIKIDERIKVKVTEPKQWKVILLNDDTTAVEFVVALLMEVFKHSQESAQDITMQVHETGSGIAGIYSFEIAEVKTIEATNLARENDYSLQIKLEEE